MLDVEALHEPRGTDARRFILFRVACYGSTVQDVRNIFGEFAL
jgi:hypothetical protein